MGERGTKRLVFSGARLLPPLVSGMRVRIYTPRDADLEQGTLLVQYLQVLVLPEVVKEMFPIDGSTVRMRSVTILVRMCSQNPAISVSEMQSLWYNQQAPQPQPGGDAYSDGSSTRSGSASSSQHGFSMQSYFGSCSHGKVAFLPQDNIVVGPVELPCTGVSPKGSPYNFSSCTEDDYFGWAEAAEALANTSLGIDLSLYRHRLFVLPAAPACTWNGMATIGCGDSCYAWVRGASAHNLSTVFHELLHNYGAEHASVPGSAEYGDASDPLGACCSVRCPNAPHSWQLGWSRPVADLDGGSMPEGMWHMFTLPASALSDTNLVRVTPNWAVATAADRDGNGAAGVDPDNGGAAAIARSAPAGGSSSGSDRLSTLRPAGPTLFLSYRTAENYDVGLGPDAVNRVSVHIFNGTQHVMGGYHTELQAYVGRGQAWGGPNTTLRLTVRVDETATGSARVALCRAAGPREYNCVDGLDNDCDGAADEDDPDCMLAALPHACDRDGHCDADAGEGPSSCPSDCPTACGDGFCDLRRGETAADCPNDCQPRCGDNYCDSHRGETGAGCSLDCPAAVCGDGMCEVGSEDPVSCAVDCCPRPICGDGMCDAFAGEDCTTCPQDCRSGRKAGGGCAFCCGATDFGCDDPRCSKRGVTRCRTTCV